MKKTPPILGFAQRDYRLEHIFIDAFNRFRAADMDCHKYEKLTSDERTPETINAWVEATNKLSEAGAILVIFACSYLEYRLYLYGIGHIHPESWKAHLDNLRTLSKWLIIPRLCEQRNIPEDHPAINSLKELLKARNSVIHPKVTLMIDSVPSKSLKVESDRFLSACRGAKKTVYSLIKLLDDKTEQGAAANP